MVLVGIMILQADAAEMKTNDICFSFPTTIDRILLIEQNFAFDNDSISKPDTLYVETNNNLYRKIVNGIEKVDCCGTRMKEKCGQDIVDLFIKVEINSGNSFIIQCEREICPKGVVKKHSKVKPTSIYLGNIDGQLLPKPELIKDITDLYWKIKEKK